MNAPCIDPIDECEIDELACGDNQVCSNGIGRADCACAAGYVHEEQWVGAECGRDGMEVLRDSGDALDFESGRLVPLDDPSADLFRERPPLCSRRGDSGAPGGPDCGPNDGRRYTEERVDGFDALMVGEVCLRTAEGHYYVYRPMDFAPEVPVLFSSTHCAEGNGGDEDALNCVDIDECAVAYCGAGGTC